MFCIGSYHVNCYNVMRVSSLLCSNSCRRSLPARSIHSLHHYLYSISSLSIFKVDVVQYFAVFCCIVLFSCFGRAPFYYVFCPMCTHFWVGLLSISILPSRASRVITANIIWPSTAGDWSNHGDRTVLWDKHASPTLRIGHE